MDKDKIQKMRTCAIWLIKHLCVDTEATSAKIEQNINYQGKKLGRYRITIEKIDEKL